MIEKCLQAGDHSVISSVAQEISASKSFGQLLHDPFANYVVQTLLAIGSDDEACPPPKSVDELIECLRVLAAPTLPRLQNLGDQIICEHVTLERHCQAPQ